MGRRPGIRDEAKRKAVIEAAAALIADHGTTVPLAEIAQRSGVARQTIYNQFGGRAGLLAALLRGETLAACPSCAAEAADSPYASLAAYAVELLRWLQQPETATSLRAAGRGLAIAPGRLAVASPCSQQALADYLWREARGGRLAVADPPTSAELFLDLVLAGPQLRLCLGVAQRPLDIHARADACARLFIHGCAAGPAPADAAAPGPAAGRRPC